METFYERCLINEIIDESETGSEEGPHDGSLFGGLSLSCLSDSAPSTGRSTDSLESFSSPIRRRERNPSRPDFGGESRYSNREVPLDLPTSQENEELRRYNPTAYFLLNDAWRCLNNVYGTMSMMEDLSIGPSIYHRRVEEAAEAHAFAESNLVPEREAFRPDPSIRRVNRFVPGQLLYRHDPVKRFELYREEWARKPAPGEQKRLALRWKVREYMLRHDIPLFDPRKQTAEHAAHPKDWSPRPYLD
ncbi:hypothetical protein OESDEN_19659 [Oesophagostomum dentatum]|uniref:Centriolar and ciliogenesis-associated protein HYLS1 C-terminal domain-containing protein n=1 Tax=Oesophagostomum dentatum TaxID=61180 RepID=A0A0B1S5S2_OESDE|nr:hypothetical protein OESDEN_19659 [Oesophagostomum dentatum]